MSFWRPVCWACRFQQFSRGKLMFLPCLARVLGLRAVHRFPAGNRTGGGAPGRPGGREILAGKRRLGRGCRRPPCPMGTTGGSSGIAGAHGDRHQPQGTGGRARLSGPPPKLIYVKGVIDVNVDDAGNALSCKDYARPDPATGEMFSISRVHGDVRPGRPVRPRTTRAGGRKKRAWLRPRRRQRACASAFHPTPRFLASARDATLIGAWLDIRGNTAAASR